MHWKTDKHTRHRLTSRFIGSIAVVLFWSMGSFTVLPEWGNGNIDEVRTLYPSEWNVGYPAGLAYARHSDQLFLLDRGDVGAAQATRPTMAIITPYEDLVAMVELPVVMEDVVNITYDDEAQHLLLLDSQREVIVQFAIDDEGQIDDAAYFDVAHLAIIDAEGMAVDAGARHLLILDTGAQQIVRVDIDNEFSLVSTVEIKGLGTPNVRGIAVHPQSQNVFVVAGPTNVLYELNQAGQIVNHYDLSSLEIVDPRAMAFAPSADLTDDPAIVHLYLADSNVREDMTRQNRGMHWLDNMCQATSNELVDEHIVPTETDAVYGRVLELELNPATKFDLCGVH